jgi:hypothetical protein
MNYIANGKIASRGNVRNTAFAAIRIFFALLFIVSKVEIFTPFGNV